MTIPPTEQVSVTDPAHPLYGLTLPCLGVTTKQLLGRVCVVWLAPGVTRLIPLAATDRGAVPVVPSPCRLSVEGLRHLLSVPGSMRDDTIDQPAQEDIHGYLSDAAAPAPTPAAPTRLALAPAPDAGAGGGQRAAAAPQRLWATLAPVERERIRQGILRVVLEVTHEHAAAEP